MTSIYLVRHCQAQGNVNRVFQGRIDSEISEEGRRQLDRLAERFRRIPLDAVYTSPLQRARLTAEALNRYHGLPVRTDARFIEIDGGCWEGHSWEEFPHTDPQQCDDWLNAPWRFQTRGGEAMACVYARMAEGLTAVAAAHPGEAVAVASHGCAIRNALCWARGWPIERLGEVPWADNTAVALLAWEEGRPRIVFENDCSNLEEKPSQVETSSWWRK